MFKPNHGSFVDIEFGGDYFICGEIEERGHVSAKYREMKGTDNYQVDIIVSDHCAKTFMVQPTPMGDVLPPKERSSGKPSQE